MSETCTLFLSLLDDIRLILIVRKCVLKRIHFIKYVLELKIDFVFMFTVFIINRSGWNNNDDITSSGVLLPIKKIEFLWLCVLPCYPRGKKEFSTAG